MATFPQQVPTERLEEELRSFYDEKNNEISTKLERYQRRTVAGADGENHSEVAYNNQQLQRTFQNLENGEEKVDVEWYEPVIERSSPPKVSMQKRSFQLEHRYGKWIKHDHDLT